MSFVRRVLFLGAAMAAGLAAAPADAQKAKDELRVIWRNVIPNVDPYFNGLRDGDAGVADVGAVMRPAPARATAAPPR